MNTQLDLIPKKQLPSQLEVEWLVNTLRGCDWTTAQEILEAQQQPTTEEFKRRIRTLVSQSQGRIAGGQKGYKLVAEMTSEEYHHFRTWMLGQATEMQRRVVVSDKQFYSRQPVPA